MKTVAVTTGYSPYGDYKAGERVVIDGYCRGGDNTPCAVVIKSDKRFVCVPVYSLQFVEYIKEP